MSCRPRLFNRHSAFFSPCFFFFSITENRQSSRTLGPTALVFRYVPSIMSLACNLKELGLSQKFIVAALDQTAFEKLQAAGVPSYLETFHEKARDSIKGGKYNTKAFRDITKLKVSRDIGAMQPVGE